MKYLRLWLVGALACLLGCAGSVVAQVDSSALRQSSRVAILPFANLAEAADVASQIAHLIRSELLRKSVELADSAAVSETLRKHRIRNTAELELSESQFVAQETSTRYLLLGSIDRYEQTDSSAEVALSARLLDVRTSTLVWANSVALHRDPRVNFLGLGSRRADRLADKAVRKLFAQFRTGLPKKMKVVEAVKVPGKTPPEMPCRRIMVVTFGNETDTHFAGTILANELLSALMKRGFIPVDPGRVRETMLNSKELMQGEISNDLLKKCSEDLGADFVLTGTVSLFESARTQISEDPVVAFEARLIDARRGEPVWAKTYSRNGKDSAWIFDLGHVHGLTVLSERISRQLASDLPVRRARISVSPGLVPEKNP